MLKNDEWILEQAQQGMITPFESRLVRRVEEKDGELSVIGLPVISYGLSSYGYDLRLSDVDFKIFRHIPGKIVDPKKFNPNNLESVELHSDETGKYFILPAHSYGLGVSMERLQIPANITCIFIGKSTYARCGLIWNLTPGESMWEGYLTLEVSNSSSADCKIYANEGVVQALFLEGKPCKTTYNDRAGKYQNQPQEIVLARI